MGRSILFTTTLAMIFTGCLPPALQQNNLNVSNTQASSMFRTNESLFLTKLESNTSTEIRNEFIDEFLLKSDVQCREYLKNPNQHRSKSKNEDELYINIAHTVGAVLGLGYITQTAETIFLNNSESNKEGQKAYESALSPEIEKGVEIVRERYAKKIQRKKRFPITRYDINQVRKDLNVYDKQCNKEYGLIEINRALKEMQNQMRHPPRYSKPSSPKINPESVAKKVKAITKEVKKKKEIKKKQEEKEASNKNNKK